MLKYYLVIKMNSVIDYFENTCLKYSDKTAIICEENSITYGELLNKSKMIASYLKSYVTLNNPVIVFMDKGINTISSFLGILYAGCPYSLLNPEFPNERIMQIKEVLGTNIILANNETIDKAKEVFINDTIFNVDSINGQIDEEFILDIKSKKIDLDPVYINFTSGSTGVPKGVMIGNRSIIDFILEFTEDFNISDKDIIANQAPFDFDVSVKDIYSAFFKGATLLIVPKAYFSSPAKLLDYITINNATTLIWAVSALCLITTFHGLDYKVPEKVNKVIFSGEVMPLKHLNIWMEKLSEATFVNVYGPTEITCNCTYHIIDRNREYIDNIPIGKPFKNERVFLLDDDEKLVTREGELGEICVSGSCVGLGYYNNKEQNDKYFKQNPLNNNYFERIYKTGDYAKYNDLGELIFCGRKDFQIKYMGHRIELEEIDKKIMDIEGVERSTTLFDEEKSKLVCFYVGSIDNKDLKISLSNNLPVYMVPSKVIMVDNFPLTKNGKIDRKELFNMYRSN